MRTPNRDTSRPTSPPPPTHTHQAATAAGDAIAAAPRQSERRSSGRASRRLKIGIVGFGKFGQFISRKFVADHDVVAMGRGDYTAAADEMGASSLVLLVRCLLSFVAVVTACCCWLSLLFLK